MKHLVSLCLIFLLGTATQAAAQEGDNPEAIRAGGGALMFSMGSLLGSPGLLDGLGIGGRYFLTDTFALRAVVVPDVSFANTSDGEKDQGTGHELQSHSLGGTVNLGLDVVLHRVGERMVFFGGGYVVASFSNAREIELDRAMDIEEDTTTRDASGAILGTMGATFFVAQQVSVGVEYRMGPRIEWNRTIDVWDGEEESRITTLHSYLLSESAGFQLSTWF